MPGLFGVLDISSRALLVNQRAVQTTGHNIANANTEGYSRQRQILAAELPTVHPSGNLGTGVRQITIERFSDSFLQAQLVQQESSGGATDAQARALSAVEQVFNEQAGGGLSDALSRLYDAFSALASSPTPGAPSERAQVVSSAQSLLSQIHDADRQLRDFQGSLDGTIVTLLPEINQLASQINELNGQIAFQEVSAPANDLRDQRDLAVRKLSALIDVHTFEDPGGKLVVYAAGGLPLVEGNRARTLVAVADPTNAFDPTFSRVHYRDGSLDVDITDQIGGGQLGGLLRGRDTILASSIRSLDTLAFNLVDQVNQVHSAGVGLNGASGNFFQALPAVEDAARDVALDPAILANPDAIAAGLSSAPSDNRNALALAALRDTASAIFLPGDLPGPPSGPTRSLLDHTAAISADVGQQARNMKLSQSQNQRVMESLQNRRDDVSGVSVDEEVTLLVRLQAAFQANARMVSSVDRMLQDVLSLVG